MDKAFNPFVVYGASKSGTTWLQKILDSHPEVRCHFQLQLFPFLSEKGKVSVSARVALSKLKSPFKSVFKDNKKEREYWVRLRYLQMLRPVLERETATLKQRFSEQEDQQYLDQLLLDTYRSITPFFLKDQPAKAYGLKSTTDLEFLFRVFPQARVISIVRDGRDVVTSKRFHMRRRGAYYLGEEKYAWHRWLNRFFPSRLLLQKLNARFGLLGSEYYQELDPENMSFTEASLEKFARDWAMTTRFIRNFQERYPEQFLLVNYESLKSEPIESIRSILQFLEVDDSDEVIAEVRAATDFARLKGDTKDGFFRKGKPGDWKNYFREIDKERFKKYTGDLLVDLGYEKDQSW
ncbi:MAG: hypothetical protein GYB31_13210 [Bacteroidetes bacterium]|nr:hypothetical protein [Bacteroidota bacterium]